MEMVVFGFTYKKTGIELREKVSFTKSKLLRAYQLLNNSSFIEEAVILSTCNRSLLFATVESLEIAEVWLKDFYADFFALENNQLTGQYIYKEGIEVVRYIFEISCGLDSLVLGEDQILGQVKDAYQMAMESKSTGKVLNRLFLDAITLAKETRTKTGISETPLSISSIAIKQLEAILGTLKGKKVLMVGFGEMSKLAAQNLLSKEVESIYICNRSKERVREFEEKYSQIKSFPYNLRYSIINEIDAVISATSAPHYVFYSQDLNNYYTAQKKICMMDLALPRDIDPLIAQIEGINLCHIDHLKQIADESMAYRRECIEIIQHDIEKSLAQYLNWYKCMPVYSRINALKNYSGQMVDRELKLIEKKLSHLCCDDKELIQQAFKRISNKLWNKPILNMKSASLNGRGKEIGEVVDMLFELNHCTEGER